MPDTQLPPETPLRVVGGDLLLDVWAVPGAARTEIKGVHDGALRVRVAAPAADGRANRAVARFLSRRLECDVTIVRGGRSRRKLLRIDSTDVAAVAASLGIGFG